MGTDKRERQKANKAARIEAQQAAEARARRMGTIRNLVVLVAIVAVIALIFGLTSCSSSSSDGAKETTTTSSSTSTKGSGKGDECPSAPDGKRTVDFTEQPTAGIEKGDEVTATFETTEGTVVVELDTERTPKTVDNFVALAERCYFDGTDLFRTEAQSGIIQGGSPHTQDNTDQGPGYTIEDEGLPFSSKDYAPGTIAMANTGQPNSGSAQFFFLANEGGRYLGDQQAIGPSAGSYAVFGQATSGLDVLEKIAALDDGSSAPSKQVTIESVTIDRG
ncbi:MAG: peptidylprolyl isomerase [Acidimicrobiales bacterium]